MNATPLGLLLSTVVASAEAAMALTPIALIPQVVLGGLMVPMTTNASLKPLMYLMPSRWGFEGGDLERARRDRVATRVEHRPAQARPDQPARFHVCGSLPVRHRANGERFDHGRVGFYRVEFSMAARDHPICDDRVHDSGRFGRAAPARPGVSEWNATQCVS